LVLKEEESFSFLINQIMEMFDLPKKYWRHILSPA